MMIKLNDILKSRKITQTAISKDTGISQPMINKYAMNKSEPGIDTLCIIADYLHITVDELLGREINIVNLASLDAKTREAVQAVLEMTSDEVSKLLDIIKIVKS